jgi:hypothetical protein
VIGTDGNVSPFFIHGAEAMATSILGLGTVVSVDDDDSGTTFTAVTLVIDATPPGRERQEVDETHLTSTLEVAEMGIETASYFEFTQYWEPEDTVHAAIDTLFGSKTQVIWTIGYANSTTTDTFEGKVQMLGPEQITKEQKVKRKVKIRRLTAITRT